MTSWVQRLPERARLGLLTLAPILSLLALLILLPPDGSERAEWARFIGRFHLLAVHLPIALILLVPVLELAGRNPGFPYLRPSAGFVLGLATLSAIVAAILGWCLARSGGYSGSLVTQHMWGGVSLTTLCWLCWVLRGRASGGRWGLLYPIVLAIAVGVMAWTGYRGGQLSRGEDHLTEYMPAGLRKWLGLSAPAAPAAGADTFFGARIQPIFAGHCFTCHGPDKHKSNLRLDSYGSLMRGGKHGPVITAGSLQGSQLFRRITLPPNDDDFMPKENKRPLSADEVKLVELWIVAGASATQAVNAIKGAPAPTTVAAEVSFEKIDFAAVAKLRAPLTPTVAQLRKRLPNILDYESRASTDLVLNASLLGDSFGDADLAALSPVAEHIVSADFSRTAITDRSAPAIAAMKRLRVLRLMHTKITNATVQALGGLNQLESLSVFGTAVTPAVLPIVARLPKLQHLYAGETTIPSSVPIPEALKDKVLY
jgi:uncharacterized membrane protein